MSVKTVVGGVQGTFGAAKSSVNSSIPRAFPTLHSQPLNVAMLKATGPDSLKVVVPIKGFPGLCGPPLITIGTNSLGPFLDVGLVVRTDVRLRAAFLPLHPGRGSEEVLRLGDGVGERVDVVDAGCDFCLAHVDY